VGASVLAMTRTVGPRLAAAGVPGATREAVISVAGTLGVVVPPSLVLILLGDALLTAHTIASNATGATARIINTQDLMRGALPAAGLFVVLALGVAAVVGRGAALGHNAVPRPSVRELVIALVTVGIIGGLLGGVAAGKFYAVEAAAAGAVLVFAGAVASGRLRDGALGRVLSETLVGTGVLFAPLMAATTFTLVLRLLGTDKLVEGFITGLPGGPGVALAVALVALMLAALALDAFEIIFVVVPILAPPLLMRAPDAVWVGVLILLVLQSSFLLPPFGAALMLARANLQTGAKLSATVTALTPFLVAQMVVLGLVLAVPQLTHLLDPPPAAGAATQPLSAADTEKRLREMLRQHTPGLPSVPNLPPLR
jgi:TRAP-type mannitol/chloroaromatic compound transport system permease large subunit